MNLYDGKGNQIEVKEVTTKIIVDNFRQAVANGDINVSTIGSTLPYDESVFGTSWIQNANASYDELLSAYKEINTDGIPFFVTTDQHGGGLDSHVWLNNKDVDGMEMLSINLGDCVQGFSIALTIENYNKIRLVKNYVGLCGNHDAQIGADTPSYYWTDRLFFGRNSRTYDHYGDRVVYDNMRNCKFIALNPHTFQTSENRNDFNFGDSESAPLIAFQGEQIDFIISELSKDDGYDIVILMHELFCDDSSKVYKAPRNGSNSTKVMQDLSNSDWINQHGTIKNTNFPYVNKIFADFVDRTSGSCMDMYRVMHPYDFTNATGRILCMLHGHWHCERYRMEHNILRYVFDRQSSDGYGGAIASWHDNSFGLIDRKNNKLKIWRFSKDHKYDMFEHNLTGPDTI